MRQEKQSRCTELKNKTVILEIIINMKSSKEKLTKLAINNKQKQVKVLAHLHHHHHHQNHYHHHQPLLLLQTLPNLATIVLLFFLQTRKLDNPQHRLIVVLSVTLAGTIITTTTRR